MPSNRQIAVQASSFNGGVTKDVAVASDAYFAWLQAQVSTTPVLVGNAQAALLGAVASYAGTSAQPDAKNVTKLADELLVVINAAAVGNTS